MFAQRPLRSTQQSARRQGEQGVESLRVQKIIDAIYESSAKNKEIAIK